MQPIIVRNIRNSDYPAHPLNHQTETIGSGKQLFRNVSKKRLTTEKTCDNILGQLRLRHARVVELVDSLDSGSSAHSGHAGSSPASRTIKETSFVYHGKRGFFLHFGVKTG